MNKKLNKYLQTVSIELKGLEGEQRAAELHEMRQHLEAIVARLIEGGLSESEAIEAAIAQFGDAKTVGRGLNFVNVERASVWRALMATMCAIATYYLMMSAFELLGGWRMNLGMSGLVTSLFYAYFPLLSGAVAGSISRSWPERVLAISSVAAVALHSGSWLLWWPSSLTLLALISAGALIGSRWNLNFRITTEIEKPLPV